MPGPLGKVALAAAQRVAVETVELVLGKGAKQIAVADRS
jgi:hypothetical protein